MTGPRPRATAMLDICVQTASRVSGAPSVTELRAWARAAAGTHQHGEVTIRIVGDSESAGLNLRYRGKSGPTNVLSFPYPAVPGAPRVLCGDLVLCAPVVLRQAAEQHKPVTQHWAHLVVHGMLHLQGYDHEVADAAAEMETLEVNILKSLNIQNPYEVREA